MRKTHQSDQHVSVSFSLPRSIKAEMDRRARSLRISRSDYLKLMVLQDLDKGEDAPFDVSRTPLAPAKGNRRKVRTA